MIAKKRAASSGVRDGKGEEKIREFRKAVWGFYRKQGRHELAWRKTTDVYEILVSEVMLQQTQVERVVGYYARFMKRFPTAAALAAAPLSDVLKLWQGLGYNRRAKMLQAAAKELVRGAKGAPFVAKGAPFGVEDLEALPGVGPYTARAVAAFAWNQGVTFIETNIRTAVIHHFFPRKKAVSDSEIMTILQEARPKGRAREWNWALMDYGSYLKKTGVKVHRRASSYTKQSKFEGSLRQARGAILRTLAHGPASKAVLMELMGPERREQANKALASLTREGMARHSHGRYSLPGYD